MLSYIHTYNDVRQVVCVTDGLLDAIDAVCLRLLMVTERPESRSIPQVFPHLHRIVQVKTRVCAEPDCILYRTAVLSDVHCVQ